jgi:hypothetical protein
VLGKTREHGTIIMTIENLNKKLMDGGMDLVKRNEVIEALKSRPGESIEEKAARALQQLDNIADFGKLFKQFKDDYEGPRDKVDKNSKSYLSEVLANEEAWARDGQDKRELLKIIATLK